METFLVLHGGRKVSGERSQPMEAVEVSAFLQDVAEVIFSLSKSILKWEGRITERSEA